MPTIAELEAKITVNDKEYTQGLNRAKKSIQGFANEIKPIVQGVGLAIAGGLGYSIKKAIDFDSLKRGLTAVAGSSAEAEKQLKSLKEVAKLPGLGFEEAIKGSIRLQAAGLSAQLAEKSLKEFGNAIAIVGGGKAELDGVGIALSQIASKGKVTAEEINQIAERVPQVRIAMKEAFGTANTEAIQKMGISATAFIEGITGALEKVPRASGGVKNSIENLKDSVDSAARSVGEALLPTVQKLVGWIEKATTWFNNLSSTTKNAIAITAALTLGLGVLAAAAAKIVTIFTTLKTAMVAYSVASGGAATATGGLKVAMVGLQAAILPLTAVVLALADAWLIVETFSLRAKAAQEQARGQAQQASIAQRRFFDETVAAAKGSEARLKQLFQTWIVFQGGVTDKKYALDALNFALAKSGKQFDAHGNIVKMVAQNYEKAAGAAKRFAAAKGGLQPQWDTSTRPGTGNSENPGNPFGSSMFEVIGGLEKAGEKAAPVMTRFGESIRRIWNETKLMRAHTELARLETEHFIETGEKWTDEQRAQIAGALAHRDATAKMIEATKIAGQALTNATGIMIGFGNAIRKGNDDMSEFTEGLEAVKRLSDAAGEELTEIVQVSGQFMRDAENFAWAFSDAFMNGIKRIREEGFGGLLRSFEEMLIEMAMRFIQSQLVSLMTGFFANLLGGLGGGISGGDGAASGGFGQGTPFGRLEMAGGGGVNVVMNIMTPDANSFRQSQDQIMSDGIRAGMAAARRGF